MTITKKHIFIIWTFILFGITFTNCKKYPENTLWFTKAETTFKGGKITSFTVDGKDSIQLFNSTWGYDITQKSFYLYKPYHDNSWWDIKGDFEGTFIFQGSKEIGFDLRTPETYSVQSQVYNPFSMQGQSEGKVDGRWDILKCTRKKVLVLRRKMYGKTYEVQFN